MARTYQPDRLGFRALGRSPQVADATLTGARRIATDARAANPEGEYVTGSRVVPSGWNNELRAGAYVRETVPGRGPRDRVLARAAQGAAQ